MYSNIAVAEEVARGYPIQQRTFAASRNKPGRSSVGRSLRDFPGLYLAHGRSQRPTVGAGPGTAMQLTDHW